MICQSYTRLRLLTWLLIAATAIGGCGTAAQPPQETDPPAPVTAGPEPAGAEPEPEPARAEEPEDAAAPAPPVEGAVAADLDGDGEAEWIRGLSDAWSQEPIEIYAADGQLLYTWETYGWERRVSLHTLPDQPRAVVLEWRRFEGGQTEVGIQAFGRRAFSSRNVPL